MEQLTIAMAKGRTATKAMKLLEQAGIYFSSLQNESRKLVIVDDARQVRLIFVKAVDVPTYVEKGAADVGIIGKDVLLEDPKDVYEMLDLRISRCKLVVAGFPGEYPSSQLTVASKYPHVAKTFFADKGIRTEVITLNGSVELAPLIGMTDVIVDIVETGKTLEENGLVVLEEIADSSARLIVNKASYAIKTGIIQKLIGSVREGMEVHM